MFTMNKKAFEKEMDELAWGLVALIVLAIFS